MRNSSSIICLYREKPELEFAGFFLNLYHIEKSIGINNANVGKYLKEEIHTLSGYIAVKVICENQALSEKWIIEKSLPLAKERMEKTKLLRISDKELAALDHDQIIRIQQIIDEKKIVANDKK